MIENGKYPDKVIDEQKLRQKVALIEANFDLDTPADELEEQCTEGQSGAMKIHVVRTWLEHAYAVGDSTALDHNDGKPFYTSPVTYHDKIEVING